MSDDAGREARTPETLFLVDALSSIEALGNLTHLISADAENITAVHSYVREAEDILRRLAGLVRTRCGAETEAPVS